MSDAYSKYFGALSDPTRRAIVETLARGGRSVSALAEPHDMALPTFLRHLQVLEKAGLVRTVKKGRVRICTLEVAGIMDMQGWLAWQREIWENRDS
ncbi:ArsR/SmtB family transcription factor [Nereida sp. MMG025]|uniref:ArsR/SmtB family transcription factor n=1 Tax=Nereida sp. MMG025 TaxID=2909981 RepID=UPI00351CE8D9